jgi:hypothetical protein
VAKKHSRAAYQWRSMDIHIHTPASSDFQQADVNYLEILQRAENRGLEIIAFTDHNTVAGYRHMQEELSQLELLEKLNRLLPEEKQRLQEYRRLKNKILVLPGFEFTATFGFHIIGLFSPEKPVREIEHLLLTLNIAPAILDEGAANVGSTADVLTAYRTINQAGGLVIAAHANSANGVAMRGFNFGGQTRIAYTQDPNLHALEVTDLELKGPRSTAAFFNGTKPEYPRRMHCIQGSDSHRLASDSARKKNPGIGDRATDVLLPEISFEALSELFLGNDFSRTRPHRHKEEPAFDFIQAALDEGSNIIQDFHESMTVRGGKLYNVLADICAFSNTNGGTLYIGLSTEPKKGPQGLLDVENSINALEKEISTRISPPLQCTIDAHDFKGKKIVRILVPRADDPPYALDDNKIYVRDEAETGLAVRDEIVGLVLRGKQIQSASAPASVSIPPVSAGSAGVEEAIPQPYLSEPIMPKEEPGDLTPKTGVEVIPDTERESGRYFTMRDLRNGNVVKNVTRSSARRLWHYAISTYAELFPKIGQLEIPWQGEFGLLKRHKQGKTALFDLIEKTPNGYRFFFGVTEDGIHGPWKNLIGEEES